MKRRIRRLRSLFKTYCQLVVGKASRCSSSCLVIESYSEPRDIPQLNSASTPEFAALLQSLPSTSEGTRLSDGELSATISLRLKLPVAAAIVCACGQPLDLIKIDALSCN